MAYYGHVDAYYRCGHREEVALAKGQTREEVARALGDTVKRLCPRCAEEEAHAARLTPMQLVDRLLIALEDVDPLAQSGPAVRCVCGAGRDFEWSAGHSPLCAFGLAERLRGMRAGRA